MLHFKKRALQFFSTNGKGKWLLSDTKVVT